MKSSQMFPDAAAPSRSRASRWGSLLLGLSLLSTGCGETLAEAGPQANEAQATQAPLFGFPFPLPPTVTAYADAYYSGTSQLFLPGFYNINQLSVGNDTISSVKVPNGWQVKLYADANFSGQSKTLTSDTDLWATGSFNDLTSSLRIVPSKATIEHFFPTSVRFATGEDCIAPAQTGQTTGIALYHAGPHPRNASRVMVTFGLVFRQDCGLAGHNGAHGADSHPGDIEYFSYTLKPDASCSVGWRLHAIKTEAHSGDYKRREINEHIVDSCDAPSEIVSSLGKHALYLSWDDCSKRTPAEVCAGTSTAGFNLYDIGDSTTESPQLWTLLNSTETRDTVWASAGDGHFCGGQSISDRSDCISPAGERLAQLGTRSGDNEWELPDPDLGTSNGCPYGLDMSGGLCYQLCASGYSGSATMCIPNCPSGFRDDGLYCAKPDAYGRGAGYVSNSSCESSQGSGNCEKCIALYYPRCGDNFHATGCNICSPDCPSGMTDIGVSCQKHTYDRGVGCLP